MILKFGWGISTLRICIFISSQDVFSRCATVLLSRVISETVLRIRDTSFLWSHKLVVICFVIEWREIFWISCIIAEISVAEIIEVGSVCLWWIFLGKKKLVLKKEFTTISFGEHCAILSAWAIAWLIVSQTPAILLISLLIISSLDCLFSQ